jgi:hypothetical protein
MPNTRGTRLNPGAPNRRDDGKNQSYIRVVRCSIIVVRVGEQPKIVQRTLRGEDNVSLFGQFSFCKSHKNLLQSAMGKDGQDQAIIDNRMHLYPISTCDAVIAFIVSQPYSKSKLSQPRIESLPSPRKSP